MNPIQRLLLIVIIGITFIAYTLLYILPESPQTPAAFVELIYYSLPFIAFLVVYTAQLNQDCRQLHLYTEINIKLCIDQPQPCMADVIDHPVSLTYICSYLMEHIANLQKNYITIWFLNALLYRITTLVDNTYITYYLT